MKFGGLFFQSSNHFSSRLHAEQHAAFEALQGLGLLESAVEFVATTSDQSILVVQNSSRQASASGSRAGSRPASRQGSRHPSRLGSQPGSRRGSFTQLDQANHSFASQHSHDASMEMDSSRGYSVGHNSLQRNGSVGVVNTTRQHQQRNVYVEDYHASTLPYRHTRTASAGESHHLLTASSTLPHQSHHHTRGGSVSSESQHLLSGSSTTLPYHHTIETSESQHLANGEFTDNPHVINGSVGGDMSGYPISPPGYHLMNGSAVTSRTTHNGSALEGDFPVLTAKYHPTEQDQREKITFTYTNANGTFPRSMSLDHKDGGIGALYDDLSSYSGQSSGYATLPRKPNDFVGNSTSSAYSQRVKIFLTGRRISQNQ